MPIVIFSDADVISIIEGYSAFVIPDPSIGIGSNSLTNSSFSIFAVNASYESFHFGDPIVVDIGYAKSGVVTFGSIPSSAKITKVITRETRNCTIRADSGESLGGGNATISILFPIVQGDLTQIIGGVTTIISPPITFPQNVSDASSVHLLYTSNPPTLIETTHDFSSSPIGRTELFAQFGTVAFSCRGSGDGSSIGGNDVIFSAGYSAPFEIEVTYTVPGFSWFIPYETVIVNGRPFRVPTGSPVEAPENDPPGPSSEFYDTGSDDTPVATYWYSADWWFFYPFTTIPPDDDSDWIPSVTPPECISCLTLPLGIITVLVADASGAYRLERNKTNDTMYVRTDPDNVTTENAPIPSPTVKIGYVP